MENVHSLFRRVRKIEIHTRKLVDQLVGGDYKSIFRGRGMEFSDFRAYTEGDDPRLIDWNVTARSGTPYVKVLTEEREMMVMLLVDLSGSLRFGSLNLTKAERVAEVTAVLALSAVRTNDRVGLLTFSDEVHEYIPPDKGRCHSLHLVQKILAAADREVPANPDAALGYLGRMMKRRSLIFLVSDFRFGPGKSHLLRAFSKRHDLVGVHVFDPRELHVPPIGRIRFRDPESGETLTVNTSSPLWRQQFSKAVGEVKSNREKLWRDNRLDIISISTADDLILPLRKFFRLRKMRRRH
jgi:uncharacterized protein (DUF58 family)